MKKIFLLFIFLQLAVPFFCFSQTNELELLIETTEELPKEFQDLKKSPLSFPDFESINKHLNNIILQLQENGYIDCYLASITENERKKEKKQILATIYIGQQIDEITINYDTIDFSRKEISSISNNSTDSTFTISVKRLKKAISKLQTYKTEKGNPFASLELKYFKREDNKLSAFLILNSSKKRTIDSIIIKGYEKLPLSFVKYYAGIKKGQLFSEKKIKEKNTLLNSLPFLNSIKPPEVLFKKDTTQVYLYFEKRKNNTFDGILGFNTNEETNNLEFNGYLDLKLNNNLNYGEQLSIFYKADGRQQLNFEIAAKLPYLFKSPTGLEGSLSIFRRDSTFINTTLKTKVNYQASPSIASSIGYENNTSTNLRNETTATDVVDYTSNFITGGFQFIKAQESELFPVKALFDLEIGLGQRKIETLGENQFKIKGSSQYQFNFNTRNIFYLYNETGFLSSDQYVENELYRLGGITSIRGFNENSIDASLYSIIATEYRNLLAPNLYINSIIDVGYFENTIVPIKTNLYSIGIGLGFLTKTGLLKFALANGTVKNNAFSFQNTKIHISIVSNF